MTVINGANYQYRLQEMNGYVMWHLQPGVPNYQGAHVTISDDAHAIVVNMWNHLTLQRVAGSTHVYFALKGTNYQYLMKRYGVFSEPPAYFLALAKACVYDMQLCGKLKHSDDFRADMERQRLEREAAAAAAEAAAAAQEAARLVDEAAFTAKIAADRAAGRSAWGR